ncbi:hypothetical protein BD779DRAFT_1621585 [Infundibulicybe gibba]|nr:hypothetical protein BD779DRAFT_1621585 [Infundibulicybe gibba]
MASQIQELPPQSQTTKDGYFDGGAGDADIILRSSDNVEFHTHRILLSLASSVFRDMFTLPQNSAMKPDAEATQHIIPMAETSSTLRHFLTWCDPGTEFNCDKWADITDILELTDKYHAAALQDMIKKVIISGGWIWTNPLSVYAIAIRYRFCDLARLAAKSSLQLCLADFYSVPEMDRISAIDFHDLLRYHYNCSKQAIGATADLSWMLPGAKELFKQHGGTPNGGGAHPFGGHSGFGIWPSFDIEASNCCSPHNRSRHPRAEDLGIVTWLDDHLTLAGQLLFNQPTGKTVEKLNLLSPETWKPYQQAAACPTCRLTWRYSISRFNAELSAEVEKRIEKVPFGFAQVPQVR